MRRVGSTRTVSLLCSLVPPALLGCAGSVAVPIVTRFVPGTAESPATSDVVRGELADDSAAIPLSSTDGVEMHGILSPDDAESGAGHVESTRATGALVGGLVLLALSYGPSVYVGAQATPGYDRALSVPVAGPWLDLAQRPACAPPATPYKLPVDPCLWETAARVALVTSGSLQGLGALLTLWGLPSHSRLVEGGAPARRATRSRKEKRPVTVAVAPALGGLVLGGTF